MAGVSGQNPQLEKRGDKIRGYRSKFISSSTQVYITPKGRLATPQRGGGVSYKTAPREAVTEFKEIKQLAWAESGEYSNAKTISGYDGNQNSGICWLCGKEIFKEQRGDAKLGSLEVEHALPLKLGYMLLTIPGEVVYNGTVREERSNLKNENNHVYYDNNIYAINKTYPYKRNDEIKMEILRSHRLCNNLKSNVNFIKYSVDKGWKIKYAVLEEYEKKLQELQTELSDKNSIGTVKVDRSKLDDIVDHLNNKFSKNNDQNVDIDDVIDFVKKKSYVEHNETNTENYALELFRYLNRRDANEKEEENDDTETININFNTIKNHSRPLDVVKENEQNDQDNEKNVKDNEDCSSVKTGSGETQFGNYCTPPPSDKDNDASPEAEIEIERVNLERVDNIDMNGNNHLDEIIKEEIKKLENLVKEGQELIQTRQRAGQLQQNKKNLEKLELIQKEIYSLGRYLTPLVVGPTTRKRKKYTTLMSMREKIIKRRTD